METAKRVTPMPGFVAIKLKEAETKTDTGLELPDSSQEKPQQGIILAKGADLPESSLHSVSSVPAEVGDLIAFKKYTGHPIKFGIEEVQVVAFADVLAKINE